MPYTFHARLEPRSRSDDLAHGLAARIYDPAWLLARQWQLDEFTGDDGGSPIRVRHTGSVTFCSGYYDNGGRRTLVPGAGPIEALAEGFVAAPPALTLRRRVDVGRGLVRRLRQAGLEDRVAALGAAFPLDVAAVANEPTARGLVDLAAGRVPDGAAIYQAIEPGLRGAPASLPAIAGVTSDPALVNVALDWLAWCDHLLGPSGTGAWDERRLEHSFVVEATDSAETIELHAVGHDGGDLDWSSFDASVTAGQQPSISTIDHDAELVPTRIVFRGMPTPRWWEEEDAAIDLGGIDAHPADLARMAVLHFALVYGNDQFAVPVRMPVGAVFRTRHLLVTDTFGMTVAVRPAAQQGSASNVPGAARWTMFTLTRGTQQASPTPSSSRQAQCCR